MKVLHAICAVSAELAKEGIRKDRSNQQQGYKFRGIDDCLNALAPLMATHGLVITPECLERNVVERETRNGGALFYVTVKVAYSFRSVEDDSVVQAIVYGEAMDAADKATNKAMSAAYKYAVIQTFCIPTEGDNDADATTHEVQSQDKLATAQRYQQNKAKIATAFQEIRNDIKAIAEQPFNPEVCPPADGIDDVTWTEFLEYVGDDPDRTKIGKKVKVKMSIQEMSRVTPKERKPIMLSIQDEARRQGVPFSAWVKE